MHVPLIFLSWNFRRWKQCFSFWRLSQCPGHYHPDRIRDILEASTWVSCNAQSMLIGVATASVRSRLFSSLTKSLLNFQSMLEALPQPHWIHDVQEYQLIFFTLCNSLKVAIVHVQSMSMYVRELRTSSDAFSAQNYQLLQKASCLIFKDFFTVSTMLALEASWSYCHDKDINYLSSLQKRDPWGVLAEDVPEPSGPEGTRFWIQKKKCGSTLS